MSVQALRAIVQNRLDDTVVRLNQLLSGEDLETVQPVLKRLGRNQTLPHWYQPLKAEHCLPNLDGKTIGSVIEMLFVSVLETFTFQTGESMSLTINPAKGVDIPELGLGIKSPSENFCTSEPFFSAYERLLGSEYDAVILLTDYQSAKKKPPLKISIIKWKYLLASQMADRSLCRIARIHREWLVTENSAMAKRVMRFLAYINQQDWRAKHLLKMIEVLDDEPKIRSRIKAAIKDYDDKNLKNAKESKELLPEEAIKSITAISKVSPLYLGVIQAADDWIIDTHKDFARIPNDNEWNRYLSSPLDGMIGMSFALQWRYNFSSVFKNSSDDC
jgi:hypothetical protein